MLVGTSRAWCFVLFVFVQSVGSGGEGVTGSDDNPNSSGRAEDSESLTGSDDNPNSSGRAEDSESQESEPQRNIKYTSNQKAIYSYHDCISWFSCYVRNLCLDKTGTFIYSKSPNALHQKQEVEVHVREASGDEGGSNEGNTETNSTDTVTALGTSNIKTVFSPATFSPSAISYKTVPSPAGHGAFPTWQKYLDNSEQLVDGPIPPIAAKLLGPHMKGKDGLPANEFERMLHRFKIPIHRIKQMLEVIENFEN
jgi:hypothetical protein